MDDNTTYLGISNSSVNAFLLQAIIYGLVILSGIVGNSFVLIMYVVKMRRTQRETRYFIPILAAFDLLLCLLAATIVVGNYLPYIRVFNDVLCKTSHFLLAISMMASNALLLTIAIQRYLKVCRPLGKQIDLFWRRFATVLVITTSIIYAVPILFISGVTTSTNIYNGMNISIFACKSSNHHYPTFQFVYYLVMFGIGLANLVVTVGMYTPIMCAIYHHFKINNFNKNPTDDPYTMIIQGKGKDGAAEMPSQTAKEEMQKKRVHGDKKDGTETIPNHCGEIAMPCKKLIASNVNISMKTKTPTTNFNVMFFCIILIYLISYFPTVITIIVLSQIQISVMSSYFPWIRFLLGFYVVNHAANPFVYAHFDMKMRQNVLSLCTRKRRQ